MPGVYSYRATAFDGLTSVNVHKMLKLFSGLLLLLLSPSFITAYWQQHVKYDIDVRLIDSVHTLEGKLKVVYTNNSPDTLREVYFHLYYLAFQPGSMMDVNARKLNAARIWERISNLKPEEQGKYSFSRITVDAQHAPNEIQGTVLRVVLPYPLLPGAKTAIELDYVEQIPKQTRRGGWMSSEGVEYSMAQWYPKLAEYDEEGWHTQEYIGREFYGVWGDFDVAITLPSTFTVAATGQCMNPLEVGHGYERIARGERSGQQMPIDTPGMTTWKFRARTVHDFAWTADKLYVHDWTTWRDSITIHAIYKTSVLSYWKNALRYTEHALETYSQLYGDYPYRDFYNTHAGDGGMEYPQLIMNTGFRSEQSLAGVTAHEVAHQWFYGILANNESREAYLDEGFTSFATTIAMKRLFGEHSELPGQERSWLDWLIPKFSNKSDNYRSYLSLAHAGYEEPLDLPHDWAREDVNAGQAYSKQQAILSMLEYTLGDSVFAVGMRRYFDRWKFKHPKLRDFQKVMEETAHTDLDWFFDQWYRTTRTIDYAITGLSSAEAPGGYRTTVRLKNKELGVMPIDLTLTYADGSKDNASIPLGFRHKTGYLKPDQSLYFPVWDWVDPSYEGSVITPKRVTVAEIDTSLRLQDLNRLNNRADWLSALPRGHWTLWQQLNLNPPLDGYYAIVRPIIAPAWIPNQALSGFWLTNDIPSDHIRQGRWGTSWGIGLKYGTYLNWQGDAKVYLNAVEGLNSGQGIEGRITGMVPLEWLGRLTNFSYFAGKLNDLASTRVSIEKNVRPEYYFVGPTFKVRGYTETHDILYAPPPQSLHGHVIQSVPFHWWSKRQRVAGIGASLRSQSGASEADIYAESSVWSSTYSFFRTRLTTSFSHGLFWGMTGTLRVNGGFSEGELPVERQFSLQVADAAAHQFSDTYNAYRWLGGLKQRVGIRGGAGLLGFAIKRPAVTASEWGINMIGINWDLMLFRVPYVPQLSVEAHIGAGWIGDTFMGPEDLWRRSTVAGGVTLNVNLKGFLPWQLQGVLDQYAFTPVFKLDPAGKIFLGTSF